MNEWFFKWMNEWMNEQMDGQMNDSSLSPMVAAWLKTIF